MRQLLHSSTKVVKERFSPALVDSFRCPEELGAFETGDLSSESGFFQLGRRITCYGRCAGPIAKHPAGRLHDAGSQIGVSDSLPVLPFDPDEVLSNLWLEKYVSYPGVRQKLLHKLYYAVRPALPVSIRKHFQQARINGQRKAIFPQWPLDTTVEDVLDTVLGASLRAQGKTSAPFVWFWPHGFPACAIVTHDVETDVGLDFCPKLMDIDDSFGVKSSFQLIPEGRYRVSDQVLAAIRDRGFEINVHDLNHDGHLYSDRAEFLRRAAKINAYADRFVALGFRAGAMYRNQSWYDAFRFAYDMSVPNAGQLEAQAGGACTVRPYFIGDIVELPLTTTQDYSLFHILGDYSIERWKRQIEEIIARNGLVSFIVHPDYIIDKKAQQTYLALLRHLAELRSQGKLWIARPGEVAAWWRQRSLLAFDAALGDPLIQGSGRDKARVAYALLDEAGITYRFEQANHAAN